jgi:Prealbumin-like fold domain
LNITHFSLSAIITEKPAYYVLPMSYEKEEEQQLQVNNKQQQQDVNRTESVQNKTSSSLAETNNKLQGTLIVTKKVINEDGGNSKPSDFTIEIHGNNPSPSSFLGNSSGTIVRLDMGMYSVTESGPSGYNSTTSMDCSGAIMSVETMKCEITNAYVKPISSDTIKSN